jgi:hypothetical protein
VGDGGFKKMGKSNKLFSRNITVNYSEVREEEMRSEWRVLGGGGKRKSKKFMLHFYFFVL